MLEHVSETAAWTAALRASESARPDALFRDRFAERLAGARGRFIAERVARLDRGANGWAMVVRTRLVDELVLTSAAEGCDCVVNLAAGLDARPYRLNLPPELLWIEADLPDIVAHKENALSRERPACRLRRETIDLNDQRACAELFTKVAALARNVVVLSEGVLIYLDEGRVRALSGLLSDSPVVRRWVTDLASPGVVSMMQRTLGAVLAQAPPLFAPPDGIAYFERLGWVPREVIELFSQGIRLARVPHLFRPFGARSAPDPRRPGQKSWSAVVQLDRARARAACRI
jgi:methyltransferase (TIGR00027 family)